MDKKLIETTTLLDLPAVAKDDLGRVFVWHEYGRAGQSAPMSIHAVGLKRLLDHADVKHGSHLESVAVGQNKNEDNVSKTDQRRLR